MSAEGRARGIGAAAVALALGFFGAPHARAGEPVAATERPAASASSPSSPPDLRPGTYLDRAGELRIPANQYQLRLDEADPAHLRTLIEESVFLGLGAAWYWVDRERNLADWDFPSWEQRFSGDAWRLDTNEFPINFAGHALNGALFYSFARANDHLVPVALLYSFGTSFAWEFLLEFREKVSINDMFVTPLAGIPIGEFAHKLWRYVNGLPPDASTGRQVAAASLGFPVWLHDTMDGEAFSAEGPFDDLGFSTAVGHRFRLGYQLHLHGYGDEAVTHGLRFGGRLSTIPGEGRPGSFDLFFYDADVVTASLAAGFGGRAREWELTADTLLAGYYAQAIDRAGDGGSSLLGLSLAYLYRFQDFDGWNDRLGILHFPGPAADITSRSGEVGLALRARASADFAGIHSAAYSAWAAEAVGPGDRAKSILRKHNYYYGWGASSRLGAELRLGPLELGSRLLVAGYDSHEGLDRAQEEITLDPDSTDQVLELGASVGLRLPDTPARAGIEWTFTARRSRVESHIDERTKQTLGLVGGVEL